MAQRINVALIYGSTRAGRFCDTVALWAGERIWERSGFWLDMVDPAALESRGEDGGPDRDALQHRLDRADAFVVVTPEHNHGYPAALKSLIDAFPGSWQARPVGFVSYGGASGGVRAVDQLRLVFAALHAVTLGDAVSFAHCRDRFDAAGELREPDEAVRAMDRMLGQLEWWAATLRDARHVTPYRQVTAPAAGEPCALAGCSRSVPA